MSAKYTEADLERADKFRSSYELGQKTLTKAKNRMLAQLIADVRAEARTAFAQEVETLLRENLQHGGDKVHTQLAIVEIDALVRAEIEP